MEIFIAFGKILFGLLALYYGGNLLVRGAAGIAKRLHIPTIIIGLTVVAFGTSAPELFVSSLSSIRGSTGVAIGNIVGSNIINIALILGIICLFMPVTISASLKRRDIPVMFVSFAAMIGVMLSFSPENLSLVPGLVNRLEGVILIVLLIFYIWLLYKAARKDPEHALEVVDVGEIEEVPDHESWVKLLGFVILGIGGLALGADTLVSGASWLALNLFRISERIVGITIVAFGTSLPELVTSFIAMAKKHADISVGNVVGSNIFNSLMVLGTASVIRPISVDLGEFAMDMGFMVLVSLVFFSLALFRPQLKRGSGLVMLGLYGVYTILLFQTRF